MVREYFTSLINLGISMGFYMMIGLILVGVMNIFLKKEFIANHLGKNNLWSIIKASLLGVPLPLCSCGVVPTGLYLKEKGASDSTAVSFLISTPQTGVDSIIATYGLMGLTFAWYRPLAAFISGIAGGVFVKIFGKNGIKQVPDTNEEDCEGDSCTVDRSDEAEITELPRMTERIKKSTSYAFGTFLSDISVHFIVGLLIAALISVLIPDTLLVELGINSGIWAMLVMIVIGLPMYICSTSSIPIALTLMSKGVSPGAAFVFLFMGPFTNVASLAVISKKLGKKTTVLYVAAAVLTALAFGFLLDALTPVLNFPVYEDLHNHGVTGVWDIFKITVAGLFFLFVFYSIFKKIRAKFISKTKAEKDTGNEFAFKVEGMHCDGCASGLRDKLISAKGIKNAEVSFETSSATVNSELDSAEIINIIEKAGYKGSLITTGQNKTVCTDSSCS
jgi:uncharacterized membrane protein YraQ (UPF0718 family)/copper chaperone CopZ